MGYTHYWRAKSRNPIAPDSWALIVADAKKLVEAFGHPIGLDYEGVEATMPPDFSDDIIRLNGIGADGHEPFWFERTPKGFTFCKTAFKPYDKVVVGILACAAEHAPAELRISSDGDICDWKPALKWASGVLGRTLTDPITRQPRYA